MSTLYRSCPYCGNEYKASRPACPECGKPPFTRRRSFAVAGPRMLVIMAFFLFLSMAAYAFFLPAPTYARYQALIFGLPQTAARIVGAAGALAILAGSALALRSKSKA